MSDYITTYGGTHFYPTEPDIKDFHIRDAAHALSLICRGNGQVKQFFSVGQHCIACAEEARARGLSTRVQLACLLHDASEAYLSDVPRPLKQYLQGYHVWEERLLSLIYGKYLGTPLTEEEQQAVTAIDNDLLAYDLYFLLGEGQKEALLPLAHEFRHLLLPFQEVEDKYQRLFSELYQELCTDRKKNTAINEE